MPVPSDALRSVISRVGEETARTRRRVLNALRWVTGADPPTVAVTPRRAVWSSEWARLWRYGDPPSEAGPPVLVVHSLVSDSRILDLRPGHSFVGHLLDAGLDVFLLEWRPPDERGSGRTLTDHVDDDIPSAVREALATSGASELTLIGYCFGGILALLATARHPAGIRNLVTMATAVDFSESGVIANLLGGHGVDPRELLDRTGNLPARTVARGIRMLRPTAELRAVATLWENLDDDERVAGLRAVDDWLSDQHPFPGELFVECVEQFVHHNALMEGRVTVGDAPVSLSDVTCPFLAVVADEDFVVPPAAAVPAPELVGSEDASLLRLPAGHVAFVAGSRSSGASVPRIVEWIDAHAPRSGEAAGSGPLEDDG